MNVSSYIYNKVSSWHCSLLQRTFSSFLYSSLSALLLFTLSGCAIPDDIPYPIVEAEITDIEVEGMCDQSGTGEGEAVIDRAKRRMRVYVDDLVDLGHLRIKKVEVTNDALVIVNDTVYQTSDIYPTGKLTVQHHRDSFIVDGRHPLSVTLRTWQDYEWDFEIIQIINREVEVERQVGDAIVDPDSRVAIIYVNQSADLSKIKVKKFSLGGQHGSVTPDPTKQPSVDFTTFQRYNVKYGWSDSTYPWTVYVYTTEESVEPTATIAANAKGASVISGSRPNGVTPTVEYKATADAAWTAVAPSDVRYPTSTSYEVVLDRLHTDVEYTYRVTFNGKTIEGSSFYFEGEQLPNSSFDDWQITGDEKKPLYLPWGANDQPYWDTGNHGATTVGASNSTYAEEDGRRYADLKSKYIVIKFAAGNIFTGSYLATDGTNGVLSFGRPFTSRPVSMQFDYQYETSLITRTANGGWDNAYGKYISRALFDGLKGKPDSCSVYIALGDWEPTSYKGTPVPYLIRTRPNELHLMDMNDPHLIGFAMMTCGRNVTQWTTENLTIDYRNERTPKYIIVVASSSKYGDYFTGGEASHLKVDDFKLIY